jgi:hypothetical protein
MVASLATVCSSRGAIASYMNMLVCLAKLERHLRPTNRMPHGAQV